MILKLSEKLKEINMPIETLAFLNGTVFLAN